MNGCHRFGGTETGLQTAQVLKTENAAETLAGSAPRDTVLG
jgi:hypothetical protein